MKFTLRVTLTTILLSLVVLTVAGLGYNAHRNARFTAADLSHQVLEQTSERVDGEINQLLFTANDLGRLDARLLERGHLAVDDFPRLTRYWLEVMAVHPRVTRKALGVDATGEWCYVRRLLDGRLAVEELRRDPATGRLELREYWPDDYPRRCFRLDPDRPDDDPRGRPWYVAARQAGRQTWSETYVMHDREGGCDVPGVSCVTPVRGADGSLRGVATTSFDLVRLCEFLQEVAVGARGYAFVVEFRADGSRRVIAHPDPSVLLRGVAGEESGCRARELVPPDELSDRRVPTFLGCLPADTHPSALVGMKTVRFSHEGTVYLGAYRCLSSRETPDWLICIVLPEDDVLARVARCNRETFWIGLGILLLATLVSLYVSRLVARPLERLALETEAIGRLEVQARPVSHSAVTEVERLAVAVEETKTSLRSFQKYVPADLVRLLLSSGREATLGGEGRTVTVSFSDLAEYTAVAERVPPSELVRHLGDYFGTFSAEILASGGTVDKFIGDAIMAFWGAPSALPRHALAACATALRCRDALRELRRRWRREGKPLLFARFGIHTGPVVVGNIGSPVRLNYTVMGDAVNLASRLEAVNKHYATEILISETTRREAGPALLTRPVDWVSVKGKSETVLIHELLGLRGEAPAAGEELADLSGRALARYRERDWTGAVTAFERVLRLRPADGPARLLIGRCRAYLTQPPGADWDGVSHLNDK